MACRKALFPFAGPADQDVGDRQQDYNDLRNGNWDERKCGCLREPWQKPSEYVLAVLPWLFAQLPR